MRHNLFHRFRFFSFLLAAFPCAAQQPTQLPYPNAFVVAPLASDVERSTGGCEYLKYNVSTPYPGQSTLKYISDELRTHGWTKLDLDAFNEEDVPVQTQWKAWQNVQGNEVHTKEAQWQSKEQGVVAYKFWYFGPDTKSLRVEARYCSVMQLERVVHHVHCGPDNLLNDNLYRVSANVTKIEAVKEGFIVHVRIQNTGDKPVLIGSEGKTPDGSPHLWVLSVEQEEQGQWGYVGNECPEHSPVSWEVVNPGASIESWTLAVEFAEPNHRYAMCTRRVAHLKGKIRASIRYYRSVCDIQNSLGRMKPLFATSDAVDLPRTLE